MDFTELDEYDHQSGPDHIIPTDEYRAWTRNGATRINTKTKSHISLKPISIPSAFKECVDKSPNLDAFHLERDGQMIKITYAEFYEQVRIIAKAFIKLGLKRFHSACILGYNSPEWIISEVAAIFAGGLATGIYPTSFPDSCKYVLKDSGANICLVDTEAQLDKILQVKHEVPKLKKIIQWLGKPKLPGILTWQELIEIGKSVPDEVLEKRLRGIAINQPCLLVYTSGTTADPKGVLISHDAIVVGNRLEMCEPFHITPGDKAVSYLPMNHLGSQIFEIFPCILGGQTIHFSKPDAMKGSLFETLKEAEPTFFTGPPRIYEKLYAKIKATEKDMNFVQRILYSWAKRVGFQNTEYKKKGLLTVPFAYGLARALVLEDIHDTIGFRHLKSALITMAASDAQFQELFYSLDILLSEAYGLSETTNLCSINTIGNFRKGSVGRIVDNVECKITDPNESGIGEICFRSRHIFMGYLNKELETKQAIDEDYWLHTGDVGRLDSDGFLYLAGRIKELLVTAGGLNIAPVPIEDNVKRELNIISNAMAVAERRKFLSLLITLKTDVDSSGNLTGNLTNEVKTWLREKGSNATTVAEVTANLTESIRDGIQFGIDRANNLAVSQATKIRKWIILPQDFSHATGELGPTMKLQRHHVMEKYNSLINTLYLNT